MSVFAAAMTSLATASPRLEYLDADGSLLAVPLVSARQIRFERCSPVTPPASFKGQRSFSGLWWMASTTSHVGFRSWVGRDYLICLDFDPTVAAVSFRPLSIRWRTDQSSQSYTPDYFVRRRDGSAALLDVRVREPNDGMPEAAALAVDELGWRYDLVGRPDPVLMANLRWLAGYRNARCFNPDYGSALCAAFAVPCPLSDGAASVGDPIAVRPSLFHLLWSGALTADLHSELLNDDSVLVSVVDGCSE